MSDEDMVMPRSSERERRRGSAKGDLSGERRVSEMDFKTFCCYWVTYVYRKNVVILWSVGIHDVFN